LIQVRLAGHFRVSYPGSASFFKSGFDVKGIKAAAAILDYRGTRPRNSDFLLSVHRHLGQPAELILELAAIPDADALLRWTITTLPIRNALPDHAKQLLDTSFFERAKELGADPDLLAAISKPNRPPPHDRPTALP
jgi:hypothetical protein